MSIFIKLYTVFGGYLCLRKLYMNRWLFNPASCTVYSLHTCCVLPTYYVHIPLSRYCTTGIERGRFFPKGGGQDLDFLNYDPFKTVFMRLQSQVPNLVNQSNLKLNLTRKKWDKETSDRHREVIPTKCWPRRH